MTDLVWERDWPPRTSILVLAFAGWFDAASAATGAVDHLIEHTGATRLARIDADRFVDAQQVRPQVALSDGVTRTITWPDNVVHANDAAPAGHELVLLSGIEPHYAWRDYCDVLIELSATTSAQVVVTLGATAAQTPHTRMPMVRASSTNDELVSRFGLHRPQYQGVTGILGVLHTELDARRIPAISMQVGVPHYASATPNPKASMALLRFLENVTGISTGHADLAERVAEWERMVDEAIADSAEGSAYLPQLEAHYDLQASAEIPSSDDLAAEFERYLRDLDAGTGTGEDGTRTGTGEDDTGDGDGDTT
jgi:predicted ATP-grasp superfamily ATP-dependent carboligase